MFTKKSLLYLPLIVILVFSVAAVSVGYSAYKGYQCYSQGKIAEYILEKWETRLDLSNAQIEEIRALIDDTKVKRQEVRNKLLSERKAVAELFFTEGSTKEELLTEINNIKSDISALMDTFAGTAIDIRNVLTPEQLEKLKEYCANKSYCRYGNKARQ